ncbi:MAG: hypothetical protein RL404_710 [Pseudomonadota bacterium]
MNHTVAAIFDTYGDAQSAMNALFNEGFASGDLKLSPSVDTAEERERALRGGSAPPAEGWSIGEFFRALFGKDQYSDDAGMYAEAVRRGSYLLSIDAATEARAEQAVDILMRFSPVDLSSRAEHWRSQGWTGYQGESPVYTEEEIRNEQAGYQSQTTIAGRTPEASATAGPADAASGTSTLPVVEEQLQVGKRVVNRGGVRIYRHITETPVQESVRLQEERVTVTRTPVDQPAGAVDIGALKEGVTEIRETAEEPVVAKTAHVVEEVHVSKQVAEHTETIKDTVRRADVEVAPLGDQAGASAGLAGEDEFRQHWQSAYGGGSGKYEDYAAAYRYGANLAGQKQYQGYRWDELEPQVRSDWEASHQESPWERTKQAVRYGWEKMAGS